MSFILDALKKSESDRQRQNGPALFEVRVAPPRTRLPLWALAIAALLLINLGIVAWLMMRHPASAAGNAAAASAAVAASPPPAAAPATAAAPPATAVAQPTGATPVAAQPVTAAPPANAVPAVAAQAAPVVAAAPAGAPAVSRAPPMMAATHATGGAADTADEPNQNPEDYAPAEQPAPEGLGHVRRGTQAGVPLYQDAAVVPGTQIPQLRLDLHVFAERPQDRFVMINMHKVHEGDTLPEGVHVDSIVPEGAILSYNGSRFLLPRE
jgi:general secretion pathway protein B